MNAKKNIMTRYATVFKWLCAFMVLFFLFKRVDTAKVIEAMRYARMDLYLPMAIIFVILWFLIESQNLMFLFNLFGHNLSFREMRTIRGASYLLMIINYNLGLGAVAWYLKKRNGIPLVRASSVMFFYYFVESVGITFFAMFGCMLIMGQAPHVYLKIVLIAGCMCLSYITLFFMYRFLPAAGFLRRFRENPLFASFHEATFSGYFKLSGLRVIYFVSFIIFFFFGLQCFQVHVPLITLTGLVPVIFFIGNIPITPFGIGTIQAAMLFFFAPYGPAENILSFSIVYSATLLFLRAPIGLIYMRKTDTGLKDIHHIDIQEA
ncbi:MAG: flippase-like domain-containing protein [Proteobacteria bacterium]|nr:flippase-like domain-containing protein [Pseudomonadota bacterium]